jgi:5-hydroxyisourate hydrolase
MARLSTHVLDTARGVPAAGLRIHLHLIAGHQREMIASTVTNADGRTAAPLISGERIDPGVYELTFFAAEYFRSAGAEVTDPPFLGEVVVRVGLADATGNYHVPLLLAPYGYSTYRGT